MEGSAARIGFVNELEGTANACDIGASTMQSIGDALLNAFGPSEHVDWFVEAAVMLRGESRALRKAETGTNRPVLRVVK